MNNSSIVDVLIENIQTDQNLLQEVEVKIETAKDEKQEIVNRLKEHRKDLSVLSKYADEEQQEKVKALGFEFLESDSNVNFASSIALDLILKAKDNQLTNEALYQGYVKSLPKEEEPLKYSAFNIKCRTLFNTQKLIRVKSKDSKSSREDIIYLNGRQVKPAVEKEENKAPKNSKKDDKSDQKKEPTKSN